MKPMETPSHLAQTCVKFGGLYAYSLDHVCYQLSLHSLCCLYLKQNLVSFSHPWKVRIMQAESPVDKSIFLSILFWMLHSSSSLFATIDPPDVTIFLDMREHVIMSLEKPSQSYWISMSVVRVVGPVRWAKLFWERYVWSTETLNDEAMCNKLIHKMGKFRLINRVRK